MIIAPRVCQGGRRPPGAAAPPHLSRRGRGLPAPHPRNGCPLRGDGGGGELRPAGETGLAAGLGGIGRVRALGLLRGPGVRCGAARGGGFGDLPFLRWGGPCRQASPAAGAGRGPRDPPGPAAAEGQLPAAARPSRVSAGLALFPRVPGRCPAFTPPPCPPLPSRCRRLALVPLFHCHRQRLMGCVVRILGSITASARQERGARASAARAVSSPPPRSSLGAPLSCPLPARPAGSPAARPPPPGRPRHARRCQPAPPGPHPAALYQNKHNSRCFLTRLSPEKAASLYKGFSVGISLLKTINIIRNLLPL